LPLLHDVRTVALELELAARVHESTFGAVPAGVWLPECAYRPGGSWSHPVSGAFEADRSGIERSLERAGFSWTVLDAHQLLGGSPAGYRGALPTVRGRSAARLHRPWRIGGSGVVAFVRDPDVALQVWSRENGYPGEPAYLDFHKRHWPSGLRLWRVTDVRADLGHKAPYEPQLTDAAVAAQADHFATSLSAASDASGGCVVAPFDAELFGHWWFEGVAWLGEVLRRCDDSPRLTTTTPSRELAENRDPESTTFREGSWGDGGDHRMWLNPTTAPMWRQAAALEAEALRAATELHAPWRGAVLNELLLLLASDWPFLVTTNSARDYALARLAEHGRRLRTLLGGEDATLPRWYGKDAVFPTDLLEKAWRKVS
jgi:1,4-alpha-glucan branching enzyme